MRPLSLAFAAGEWRSARSWSKRVAPKLVQKHMGRQAHKAQMEQTETAGDDSGSLFKPMKSGRQVYGGWNSDEKQEESSRGGGSKWGVFVGMAVPAAMGLTYLLQRQRNRRQEGQAA